MKRAKRWALFWAICEHVSKQSIFIWAANTANTRIKRRIVNKIAQESSSNNQIKKLELLHFLQNEIFRGKFNNLNKPVKFHNLKILAREFFLTLH